MYCMEFSAGLDEIVFEPVVTPGLIIQPETPSGWCWSGPSRRMDLILPCKPVPMLACDALWSALTRDRYGRETVSIARLGPRRDCVFI